MPHGSREISRISRTLLQGAMALVCAFVGVQVVHAQTFVPLHTFAGFPSDGRMPQGRLVRDAVGNLYGTTTYGGIYGAGSIFKLDPEGNETILFNFFRSTNKDDGYWPAGGLTQDGAGNLYGTTSYGGNHQCNPPEGCGTVFKLDSTAHLTILHRFNQPDGTFPNGTLARDDAGNLYGAMNGGSLSSAGVFKLDTAGKLTVLLTGGNIGNVVLDSLGNLVGANYFGPVFQLNVITGQLKTWNIDATSSVVPDGAGNLYFGGGQVYCSGGASDDSDCGYLYKLDTASGALSVLHTFFGGPDGADVTDTLTVDGAGNIYGVSAFGGLPDCAGGYLLEGCGTVFKLDPAGNFTILHSFNGVSDGLNPFAGLIQDSAGNLYGTTVGPYPAGAIFEITATSPTNLSLQMTANPVQPEPGSTVTYTYVIWNHGPDSAAHELLLTEVPFSFGFSSVKVSGTAGLGSCTHPSVGNSGRVVCKQGSRMRAGSTWTVQVTMEVPAETSGFTVLLEGIASADNSNQQTASLVTTVAQ
jgi:uncharacterized repeat protein (TIGR03803 family)